MAQPRFVVRIQPRNQPRFRAHNLLVAEIDRQEGHLDQARAILKIGQQILPDYWEFWMHNGKVEEDAKNWFTAATYYQRAFDMHPSNTLANRITYRPAHGQDVIHPPLISRDSIRPPFGVSTTHAPGESARRPRGIDRHLSQSPPPPPIHKFRRRPAPTSHRRADSLPNTPGNRASARQKKLSSNSGEFSEPTSHNSRTPAPIPNRLMQLGPLAKNRRTRFRIYRSD